MLEHWRPLTGVLVATCLWALTLLALAITGLGGRVAPLRDDATGAPPLPDVRLTAVEPRLGGSGEYGEVGERPLLVADRRPVAVGPIAGEGAAAEIDVALTSVLITPTLQLAILTDNQGGASRRVRVGDVVPGTAWRLVQVEPRRAVLEGPGGQRALELRVYNGLGDGEPVPPPPPPQAADAGEEQPGQQGPARMPVEIPDPNANPPTAATPAPSPTPSETLTQEQQIEAIRRRIEARRAQMRAEAEKQADDRR